MCSCANGKLGECLYRHVLEASKCPWSHVLQVKSRLQNGTAAYGIESKTRNSRPKTQDPKTRSMQSSRSLQHRAVLALLLMVGFYVFALAIAGGLLWVPYAEYMYLERMNGRLTLFSIIGGLTILYAIIPRIDKFEAPGPR